ncbi:MAG: protein-L-isoaspartate O-methyltransferase [Alphaproteobacteria bacterium]|nr:protein-L-isoaspartate O-methyltransferase [Alphaproteobacteria bacterium]
MTTDFQKARDNMVECQIHTAGVVSPGLLERFKVVPRELFLPEKVRGIAYVDEIVSFGKGRFLLEPIIHSKLLQAARLVPTDIVLDIGGGTGYSSAILSPLVMQVVSLDEKKYIEKAARLWEKLGLENILPVEGDMPSGAPEHGPFSLILVNGAVSEVARALVNQLSPGGRLLTVVKKPGLGPGEAVIVERLEDGQPSSRVLFEAGTPYLPGFEPVSSFAF